MKNNRNKKQLGFTLIELTISLTAIAIMTTMGAVYLTNQALDTEAKAIKDRVIYVVNQVQRFYMDKIVSGVSPNNITAYPASLLALEEVGGYLEPCSPENVASGLCYDYKYLPFGGDVNDNVTLLYARPANAIHFQNLVPKDGSEPMTTDWDYGGHDLNNVRYINEVENISVKGMNDRTLVSGLSRTGVIAIESSAGMTILKPSCPDGYTPKIAVWSGGVGVSEVLYSPSNEAVWANKGTVNDWTVFYKVNTATSNTDSKRKWSYQGIISYITSCG